MACSTQILPPTKADLCDLESYTGEISQLYLTAVGDGLTDWTDAAEWGDRIDNATPFTNQDPAPIRSLFGIGSLTKPNRTEIRASRRRKIYGTPKFSMPFKVDDTSSTNWDFLRAIPNGGAQFTAWFGTEQRLFGGNDGITVTLIGDPNIPESVDDIMTIEFTLTFEAEVPEVTANPL